ncbi:hypothetical protein [Arthrobacter sp. ISL-72]|uniref:hypothetical protein n=1 Tax=Arthrobacter sp. ISL-72 TaxID=2819114 RepID=UPI001BE5F015|nr:hypothetical protein [Arthrobacter sp. ISL-72]MBT2596436.1 hypothetical protein [Arthrobacter sp. ISL-72]
MPTNVEIKARVDSLETVLPVVAALADAGPEAVVQDDTFSPARAAGSSSGLSVMTAAC